MDFPKIQKRLTLRGDGLRGVLPGQFCLCSPLLALNEKINIIELLQHNPTFFVSFLKG